MNLSRKKIIAREFLILIGCAACYFLTFVGVFGYNFLKDSKIEKLIQATEPLKITIDSLHQITSKKEEQQLWFYQEYVDRNDVDVDYTSAQLWDRLERLQKSDSVFYKWDKVWGDGLRKFLNDIGLKSAIEFDRFIKANSFLPNELDAKFRADSMATELNKVEYEIKNERGEIMSFDETMEFAFLVTIIIAAIAFPLRYLFYSIKWSFITLKQKE